MKKYQFAVAMLMFAIAAGAVVVTAKQAEAQSGSRTKGQSPVAKLPFEDRLWAYLQQVKYRNWAPAPGQNGDFYEGQSPHGAYLKMYFNRVAISGPTDLPHRSIVVKENYGADKQTLMAITVMYRMKDYDPEHNDWYWAKYNPDGTVAMSPPEKGSRPLAGKVAGCIQCHSTTADNDFVFFND